jgi:sulfoxide reductase catalytic subunit YedY
VDNSNLPITPIEGIGITATPPDVDMSNYVLSVQGLVNTPLALNYRDLLQRPAASQVLLLVCPGVFAANAAWRGVPVSTLLAEAGVRPEAVHIIVYAIDGGRQVFELGDLERDGVFLAYEVDGQTLPKEHGYPVRLVAKGKYGALWVKWVNRIELT